MYNLWKEIKVDRNFLNEISIEEMWKHIDYFSKLKRLCGSEDEKKAAEYILKKLKEYGVDAFSYEFEGLVSYPIKANLKILHPEEKNIKAITHPFALSTEKGGISGELIYIREGSEKEFIKNNVENKITLIDGVASPLIVSKGQEFKVKGQIYVSEEDIPHEMIVTTIWGTPTLESINRLPKIPVVSIGKNEGDYLKNLLKKEKNVEIFLETNVWSGWRKMIIPVAFIKGSLEPEKYVLIGGHYDSWYVGITDNATGNALCLELARIFSKYRDKLRRSIKIAWWPGHSHGRYAGSTWFVDNFWEDLNKNAIAYINIDSPGCKGAKTFIIEAMAEIREIIEEEVKSMCNVFTESRKPGRWGDQSFWGLGLVSIDAYSMAEREERRNVGGSGGGWWWHTEFDTLDKVDKEFLIRDTGIQLSIAVKLCNSLILPYDFTQSAKEAEEIIKKLMESINNLFDFNPIINIINQLNEKAKLLNTYLNFLVKKDSSLNRESLIEINNLLIKVCRVLIPVMYTISGRYDQDPAVDEPIFPSLHEVLNLLKYNINSDEFKFLKTKLIRERNRVIDAFNEAICYIEIITSKIKELLSLNY